MRGHVDAIGLCHRPLFARIHALVTQTCPEATLELSYQVPAYRVGRRRLYVGAWKHGPSIYGWGPGGEAGFTARHPELTAAKGTIQLRAREAAAIPDGEFRDLAWAALLG